MPLYDMRCSQCGREFTLMTSYEDRQKAVCPHCGATRLEQVYRPFAVGGGGQTSSGGTRCGSSGSGSHFG